MEQTQGMFCETVHSIRADMQSRRDKKHLTELVEGTNVMERLFRESQAVTILTRSDFLDKLETQLKPYPISTDKYLSKLYVLLHRNLLESVFKQHRANYLNLLSDLEKIFEYWQKVFLSKLSYFSFHFPSKIQ
jgi:hypothetical protein